jgi:hypothetical protein
LAVQWLSLEPHGPAENVAARVVKAFLFLQKPPAEK